MPKISIVSASLDSPMWARLLVKSIRKFTFMDYEILIIDNNSLPQNLTWLEEQEDIRLLKFPVNMRHGGSLDIGTKEAKSQYVCFLDIDAHIQRLGWATDLIALYESDEKIKMIGTKGPEWHPMIAPLFFYERRFILDAGISFQHLSAKATIDTGQKAYFDILEMGYKVEQLERGKKVYPCGGDEIYLCDKPSFFHNWNGTRFNENNPKIRKDILEGVTIEEHLKGKKKLFSQPKVKEILEWKS